MARRSAPSPLLHQTPRLAAFVLVAVGLTACGDGGLDISAEVVAEISVSPSVGPDIKIGPDGSVWLPASDTFQGRPPDDPRHAVVRIDADSNEVAAVIEVAHQMSAVAIGDDAVWATGTDFGPGDDQPRGSLVRIDPGTDAVVATVEFGDGASPADVAVGFGSVWVADSSRDRVMRVNADTNEVEAEIAVDGGPSSLTVAAGRVWVTKPGAGQLRPIDPRTNMPLEALSTGPNPEIVESRGSELWVADYLEQVLQRIDLDERSVAESVEFPSAPSRFSIAEKRLAAVEAEGRALSVVENGTRERILEDRLLVAVALTPDGDTVWTIDGGERTVLRVELTRS